MNSSLVPGSHPSSAVLLDYVNGSLGFAHSCVVATHLLHCAECQGTVSFWDKLSSLELARTRPVAPPPDLLNRCLASIARDTDPVGSTGVAQERQLEIGGTVLPAPLDGLSPSRLRWLAPGIRHSTLWHDDRGTLHFIRVNAGLFLPPHRHRGLELTSVLSGAYRDDGRRYDVGDISEEDDGDEDSSRGERDHLVVAEPAEDCVCIIATTGRLQFSGWLPRLLQPIMPF